MMARVQALDSESYLGGLYYAGLVAAALIGGVEAMVNLWHIVFAQAVFFVALAEVGGVYLAHMASSRQRKGERPYLIWTLSGLVAAAAFALQYEGHMAIGQTFQAYFFAGASALGYISWVIRSANKRRDALRAIGQLARPTPAYGLAQWLHHPILTSTARSIAKNSDRPMTRAETIRAAKIQHGLEQWIKATVATSTASKGKDGRTDRAGRRRARAMMTVHPSDIVAEELSVAADRDAYVRWLGSMLDPRVMTGAKAAPPPPPMPDVAAAVVKSAPARARTTVRVKPGPRTNAETAAAFAQLMVERPDLSRTEAARVLGYTGRDPARGLRKALDQAAAEAPPH